MSTVYEMSTLAGDLTQDIPVKAGVVIPAGALFALDAAGLAVPADDATAATTAGRATTEADNTGGANGAVSVIAERLAYVVENSATDAVTAALLLKPVYLEGPNTVRATQSGATEPIAGLFLGFDGEFPVVAIQAGL